mmetsp:Transcript_66282/g.151594  ORF Transcript_66282/g.151594 Transcript_66282/m.151594 type:complete len:235 (-) Transcript_66282:189-893(-)
MGSISLPVSRPHASLSSSDNWLPSKSSARRLSKRMWSLWSAFVCCAKIHAQTYRANTSRTKMDTTDRVAATIPLASISSSGTAVISRITRASRSRRRGLRTSRLFVLLATARTTQVSVTISPTRNASNRNQLSLRHWEGLSNARNRISSSVVKYTQKQFSTTTTCVAAWAIVGARLVSVSYPIHTALATITPRVTSSKARLPAMAEEHPWSDKPSRSSSVVVQLLGRRSALISS